MRKLVPWFAAATMVAVVGMAMPAMSFADTSTTTTTTTSSSSIQAELNLIASLEQQIQALTQQIQSLRQQQASTTLALVQSLSLGSQGSQVQVLQALLAADPSIYPQGLVTGYYGPLTEEAVKRFQAANGIDQVGIVGPETRGKLNALLQEHPLEFEAGSSTGPVGTTTPSISIGEGENGQNSQGNGNGQGNGGQGEGEGRLCAIVPPGHLIAPGWLRHHDNEQPVVPECQTVPPGIQGQEGSGSSSAAAPVISSVESNPTTNSATITWNTDVAANSEVFYGTTASYGSNTGLDSSLVTSHSETITGLTAGTVYHFDVVSANASGTAATSADATFTTEAAPTVSLSISGVEVSESTSTATVSWTTNLGASSEVLYGTSTAYGLSTTLDNTLLTSHSQTLSGLTPNSTYHFEAVSANASGTATSSDMTFSTNALPTAPVISGLTYSAASTTATVSWNTDQDATGIVYYGTANPLSLTATSTATMSTSTLDTSHSFTLTGLTTSTTYYYVVGSTNGSGGTTTSSQQSFVTSAS